MLAANLCRKEEVAKREGIFYRKRRLLSLVFDDSNSEHLNTLSKNRSMVGAACMIIHRVHCVLFGREVDTECLCIFLLVYSYGVGFYVLARSTAWASSEA